jgi:DtxR family Mn-dependent transcriptional regulator
MAGDATYRYLRCVYNMHLAGKRITPKAVAEEMNVKRPTAYEFIKKLEGLGFLQGNRGEYLLTPRGIREAERLVRNHRILETLLYTAGVPLEDACALASVLEGTISERDVDRICEYLGNPKYCPHGKPIPRG